MLIPARKLVMTMIACASGLLSVMSVARADDVSPQFEAVGVVAASPLPDDQMGELRGTGFADFLPAVLAGLVPRNDNAAASGLPLANGLGSIVSFLPALLDSLPPINLVAAQLNDQPTVMLIGTGPLSLGCGNGLSCPAGTTVSLYANNNAPAGSFSLNLALTQ
jgi:hypothetical protein